MTVLRVRRADTHFADRRRRYKVVLDGQVVGQIKEDQALRIPLRPGRHEFHVRIDFLRSRDEVVEADQGSDEQVEYRVDTSDWGGLVVFVRPRSYLLLRRE